MWSVYPAAVIVAQRDCQRLSKVKVLITSHSWAGYKQKLGNWQECRMSCTFHCITYIPSRGTGREGGSLGPTIWWTSKAFLYMHTWFPSECFAPPTPPPCNFMAFLFKTSSSSQLFILTTQKWLKLPCSSSSGLASADTPHVRRKSSSSGAVRSCKTITYTNLCWLYLSDDLTAIYLHIYGLFHPVSPAVSESDRERACAVLELSLWVCLLYSISWLKNYPAKITG